ncbi:MAG: hypothetical protein A3F90_13940 [Deltaproteobacteria bacterium RIFCSPLOWO2_12_FULL_60_19]|nr:MAG: hypothetical protein A3F90_13940 [Deltaproteobacteria bacterium RIFCSPLOWO2_12_FULL_60_19]
MKTRRSPFVVRGSRFGLWKSEIQNSKFKIQNGFTLLEVVVAMAIVGLGVVALLEIFSLGLRLETRSSARTEAAVYMRQVMDEVLARRALSEGSEGGPIGRNHRWQVEVRSLRDETQLAQSNWDLNEVTLTMRYADGRSEKQLEMKTLRILKKTKQ